MEDEKQNSGPQPIFENNDRLAESEPPVFTVFTPTFNRHKTLPYVFDSLMHQTFKSFEWIIVDDGSPSLPAWVEARAPR